VHDLLESALAEAAFTGTSGVAKRGILTWHAALTFLLMSYFVTWNKQTKGYSRRLQLEENISKIFKIISDLGLITLNHSCWRIFLKQIRCLGLPFSRDRIRRQHSVQNDRSKSNYYLIPLLSLYSSVRIDYSMMYGQKIRKIIV